MKNCSFMFAMALCLCSLLTPYMSYGDRNDDFAPT